MIRITIEFGRKVKSKILLNKVKTILTIVVSILTIISFVYKYFGI